MLFLQIVFLNAPIHETIVGLVILVGLAQRKIVSIVVLVSFGHKYKETKKEKPFTI